MAENEIGLGYRILNFFLSALLLVFLFPAMLAISLLIIHDSPGKFIYMQERIGHKGKKFTMFKFRVMVEGAERLKKRYEHLNYADGPVFKIKDDPRFTRIGMILSRTHIDELPQLWNVLRGEMFIVGFRPFPVEESKKAGEMEKRRTEGYPGITSIWAVSGGHEKFTFKKWMEEDIKYELKRGIYYDLRVLLLTMKSFIRSMRNLGPFIR